MNTYTKVLLFLIIILVVSLSVIFFNHNNIEKFTIDLGQNPNLDSCWHSITNIFKWNIDNYDSREKKVLLTMKNLNASYYSDKTQFNPEWTDKCVIPKEHLPIYNKDPNDKADWDLYNASPDPNSKGYMRYTTQNSEGPDGYVIDLKKHNSQSFQKFLNKASELYDEEFFKQKEALEAAIKEWTQIKINKQNTLQGLQNQVAWTENQYQILIDPSEKCQKDRVELDRLNAEYANLQELNKKALINIDNYNNAVNRNQSQLTKLQTDYDKYVI
jgi:hypothetical protein